MPGVRDRPRSCHSTYGCSGCGPKLDHGLRLGSVSYVKRVPGLDGTVSADVLNVPGYATYQIVTDLDGNRIGLWKPRSDGKRRMFGAGARLVNCRAARRSHGAAECVRSAASLHVTIERVDESADEPMEMGRLARVLALKTSGRLHRPRPSIRDSPIGPRPCGRSFSKRLSGRDARGVRLRRGGPGRDLPDAPARRRARQDSCPFASSGTRDATCLETAAGKPTRRCWRARQDSNLRPPA